MERVVLMKKYLFSLVSLIVLLSFVSLGLSDSKASAATDEETINSQLDNVAKEYDLEKVDPDLIPEDQRLNFDSVEEFEQFIKEQENDNIELSNEDAVVSSPIFSALASTSSTKTYSYTEYNGTGKIVSHARVTRKSSKVSSVKIWSEQIGVIFGITYTPNDTASYYKLNSAKTGGTAYAKGSKLYGANVGGQSVGYKKSVTYSIKF